MDDKNDKLNPLMDASLRLSLALLSSALRLSWFLVSRI